MVQHSSRRRLRRGLRWLLILGAAAAFWWSLAYYGEEFRAGLLALLEWVHVSGPWGPVLFMLVVAASMMLILPGFIFTLGAGFLFGVIKGTLFILIGTTTGACLAFLAGRFLFRHKVTAALAKREKMRRFVRIVEREGWRFVIMSRMVPLFPFKLSNYAFGTTSIPFRQFLLGTSLGIIPLSVTNVYAGSLAGSLSNLEGDGTPDSPLRWAIYAGGFVVALAFMLYVTHLARKALEPYVAEDAAD